MIELWPFIIVGGLAIAAAVMMLLSDNAVHSALFLILVMVCIAFMFLMLNASFLALIQITVYAGAIMVLFLFVIMLLGNDKLKGNPKPDENSPRHFRWYVPLTFALSLGLLFSFGFVVINAQTETGDTPQPAPMVRVLNAWGADTPISVYVDDVRVFEDLTQGDSTDWFQIPEAGARISVAPGVDGTQVSLDVQVPAGDAAAVVAFGTGAEPQLRAVTQNTATVYPSEQSRLQFINLSESYPSLQILEQTGGFVDTISALVPAIAYGQLSEVIQHDAIAVDFAIVDPARPDATIYRVDNYQFHDNDTDLLVIMDDLGSEGVVRTVLAPFRAPAEAPFGTPQQVGYSLITTFMLPFQVIGLLLLASLIGVIVLAQRLARPRTRPAQRRVVSRPLTSVIAAQVGQDVVTSADDTPRLPDSAEPAPGAGD
ncbi:MAG: NADH-quinone oxidoreductase subunit J [Anaerolineae bacterium]